jgi:rsbT co-antagonist protein RsbR
MWPVPAFEIDPTYGILSVSQEAVQLFGDVSNWLEIVDIESRGKAQRLLHPSSTLPSVELNLLDMRGRLHLCTVRQRWNADTLRGQLVCWPKDERAREVADTLRQLQEQVQQGFTVRRSEERQTERTPDRTAREALGHLSTMRDLLHILRPALLDGGKAAYVELLEHELHKLERLLS